MLYLLLSVLALSLTFICALGLAYLFFIENQCRLLRQRISALEKENRQLRAALQTDIRARQTAEAREAWPELLS